MATLAFGLFGNGQTTEKEWLGMINLFNISTNNELIKVCPKGVELEEFKKKITNGEITLSSETKNTISSFLEPLKLYGKDFAQNQRLIEIDDNSLVFYSTFSPSYSIESGFFRLPSGGTGLTQDEIINCALIALGADLAWAWMAGTGTSWSVAALTTTFTGVAKRFLGPIEVGIAVGTFSVCLYNQYQD